MVCCTGFQGRWITQQKLLSSYCCDTALIAWSKPYHLYLAFELRLKIRQKLTYSLRKNAAMICKATRSLPHQKIDRNDLLRIPKQFYYLLFRTKTKTQQFGLILVLNSEKKRFTFYTRLPLNILVRKSSRLWGYFLDGSFHAGTKDYITMKVIQKKLLCLKQKREVIWNLLECHCRLQSTLSSGFKRNVYAK